MLHFWIPMLLILGPLANRGNAKPKNTTKDSEENADGEYKRQTTQFPVYPVPKCFKKYSLSGLSSPPFQTKKLNSPQSCANFCFKINGNEDVPRTCNAFDFTARSGVCRFYEKTSQDENVWLTDHPRHDLYQTDGACVGGGQTPRPRGSNSRQTPTCFKKYESSGLNVLAFRPKKYDSPKECADACVDVFEDENEVRTCRAFDFNSRSSVCRLFEKNSHDDNVKLTDNTKTDVYEFDDDCWRTKNAPPTIQPHEEACPSGTKPLMEKVNGWYLRTSGLMFKGVDEATCYDKCLKDKLPSRDMDFKCLSVSYNNETRVCLYLNSIASPLNRRGPSLIKDSRYTYYAKMCLGGDAISKCPGYVTRFTGSKLVAMADAKLTTAGYPQCVAACLTAEAKLGFVCLSGMFYNSASSDNCILNYADHYQEPTLFIFDPKQTVDYFSVKSCHT